MNLSLEEKIGQRFIFGINGTNIECIVNLIKDNYIGGVILYKKNYKNYEEMLAIIKKIKTANKSNKLPLFIAIDQEGGRVNRMPNEFHNMKNIYDISKCGIDLVGECSDVNAKMLHNLGINMNLAPVLDIYNNSKSKVLYKRCFCGNYEDVSKCGSLYVKKMTANGVIPVIKHYPGHGISRADSHRILPYVFNYKEILDKHIKPFQYVMNEGCDALMLGHLVIRKLTKGLPASISNAFIKNYIRDNGFDGLVITDEINMLRYNLIYRFLYLKKALKSMNDIVLVKIKNEKEALAIIDKYKKTILTKDEYMNYLDSSVKRIARVKNKYKINDDFDYNEYNIDKINNMIDKLNRQVISN